MCKGHVASNEFCDLDLVFILEMFLSSIHNQRFAYQLSVALSYSNIFWCIDGFSHNELRKSCKLFFLIPCILLA